MNTNTCKNCKFWKRKSDIVGPKKIIVFRKPPAGDCKSQKFVDANDKPNDSCPKAGLRYWDYDGYSCGFETGPNFGCIHFKFNRKPK